MALALKLFQEKTLQALQYYLDAARLVGAEQAFMQCSTRPDGQPVHYHKVEGLEEVPYVCLRLPTGGGKTILAAHSVRVAATRYLEKDFPVVLWLVPTNTIRAQTLEALKKPTHAYRQVLDEAFDGRVMVFDIAEVEQIRPNDLSDRLCVVVGTLATLRVSDTDGRRIYADNENFEPHFSRVRLSAPGLERIEEGPNEGQVKFSFANLLHLNKPLILMDEAHNARTRLTFEALTRVSPACIIEFTATPDTGTRTSSNVLYRVSASELKAEDMIKLPVVLTVHVSWQEAVAAALLARQKLAEVARESGSVIRPLLLLQAESQDRAVTVDVLRQHLIENERVPEQAIAVATGKQRELDGVNLFDPACPIEVILTIEALKEGWDCSYAYVFCSVANIRSAKDVEQLLGRVLRMPFARRQAREEMNRAYAHVSSPSFSEAAQGLFDSLVAMGFQQEEAKQYVESGQMGFGDQGTLLQSPGSLRVAVSTPPDLSTLTTEERAQVHVEESSGKAEIIVTGPLSAALQEKLVAAVPGAERTTVEHALSSHRDQQVRATSPSVRGEEFVVPRLCVQLQGELELAEKELFLDVNGWNLLDYPAELPEFKFDEKARVFEFDLDGQRLRFQQVGDGHQLDLQHLDTTWTENDFARWLDKELRQPDVRQETMLEFLRRVLAYLREKGGLGLSTLARAKFILAKVLAEKIKGYRLQAYGNGYQEMLFGPQAAVETSYDYTFRFNPGVYPAHSFYSGDFRFSKHYYSVPGELEGGGEEYGCAVAIDSMPAVKYWVRNLSKQPEYSFWLPTSSDRFYPDFVALLNDGRLLVVEYKGKPYVTNDDSKEKHAVGELWELKSDGRALFVMAEKQDAQGRNVAGQLEAKIMGAPYV